jgi:hypothetical protein
MASPAELKVNGYVKSKLEQIPIEFMHSLRA